MNNERACGASPSNDGLGLVLPPRHTFCRHGQPMCAACAASADFGEQYLREWADYWRGRALAAEDQISAERVRWEPAAQKARHALANLLMTRDPKVYSDALRALDKALGPNFRAKRGQTAAQE
jgi:hypothetical protein